MDIIGSPYPTHPLPLRLRNCMISKQQGGSLGYRGAGFSRQRLRALWLAGYRSSATGLPQGSVTLEVDHIIPYRMGGLSPHTNEIHNLRVLDSSQNRFLDYATGFEEKPTARRLRAF